MYYVDLGQLPITKKRHYGSTKAGENLDSIACLFVALEADRPQVFYFIVNTNIKILLLSIGTYL